MGNPFFQFKKFIIHQDQCAMKVCTDSCILGAYAARDIETRSIFPKNILDIGAGTGLLSLMLAQKSEAAIVAIESDSTAYKQMKENFKIAPWHERLDAIFADIRQFKSSTRFDLIISNPPFYENDLKGQKPEKNAAKHDSSLLFSELFTAIQNLLAPHGKFVVLLPHNRLYYTLNLLTDHGLSADKIRHICQTPLHRPFRAIVSGGIVPGGTPYLRVIEEELVIQEKMGYTKAFIELLKDYYLYL